MNIRTISLATPLSHLAKALVGVVLVAGLSSCGIYGKYHPTTQVDSTLYGDLALSDTTENIALLGWEQLFTDPLLQDLIREALSNNIDLRVAHEHVNQAEATLRGAQLAYLPSISLAPTGAFSPQYSIRQGTYDLVASASWEIDIFGRTLNSLRGAKASKQQALDYEQAARCSLIAGVANAYYTLLMLDAQLATAVENEQTWSRTVNTTRRLKEAGMADEAAVTQMEATYYSIQTMVLDYTQQIRETENALCLLLATTHRTIPRSTLDEQTMPATLEVGVPAQLLYNRPDVRAAQQNMARAFYATNLARSNCLPSLNLSGSFGWTNHNYVGLIDPMTMISSLAASLVVPIFNSGRNIAQVKMAKSQQEEALLTFTQTVLSAGNEVNNALHDYQTAHAKTALYDKQVEALSRAQHATWLKMQYGSTTYLEVLTAQNSLLTAEFTRISNRMAELQAVVALYHALGGGNDYPTEENTAAENSQATTTEAQATPAQATQEARQ